MHVAIITPAFNVAPFLRAAILSVRNQRHTDWSMVIVDDGSADDPAAVVGAIADPRIRMIRQKNAGVSAARNAGVRAALIAGRARELTSAVVQLQPAGLPDAFLFLDGDDWLAANALTRLAATLDASPWAVAACGRYAQVAPNGATRLSRPSPDGDLLDRLLTRNLFTSGGHLLIRREAIEAAGDFRQDLIYGEDWEYWTRLALLGEFAAIRSQTPVLFVRERTGSVYRSHATNPDAYRPALRAIHGNAGIGDRLGPARMAVLGRYAQAETAWSVGRELIRHGRQRDGRRWLGRSLREAPNLKRLLLLGLALHRSGPFRPYPAAG